MTSERNHITMRMLSAGAVLVLLLVACSAERGQLTGRWVVSLPYGWQDQSLRDHSYAVATE
jgi:hypothetical protein